MGKIILVSATPLEHGGLKDINGVPIFQVGIGKTNAAMNMTEIILKEKPDVVINFGSCGNLKGHKVGGILQVGEVFNDFDTQGLSENKSIKLGNNGIKCFTTDTIYDSVHDRYTDSYLDMINKCNIVDMECYPLAYVCKKYDIPFESYKWVSDDGNVDTWEENAAIGFQNFREHFLQTFFGEY